MAAQAALHTVNVVAICPSQGTDGAYQTNPSTQGKSESRSFRYPSMSVEIHSTHDTQEHRLYKAGVVSTWSASEFVAVVPSMLLRRAQLACLLLPSLWILFPRPLGGGEICSPRPAGKPLCVPPGGRPSNAVGPCECVVGGGGRGTMAGRSIGVPCMLWGMNICRV